MSKGRQGCPCWCHSPPRLTPSTHHHREPQRQYGGDTELQTDSLPSLRFCRPSGGAGQRMGSLIEQTLLPLCSSYLIGYIPVPPSHLTRDIRQGPVWCEIWGLPKLQRGEGSPRLLLNRLAKIKLGPLQSLSLGPPLVFSTRPLPNFYLLCVPIRPLVENEATQPHAGFTQEALGNVWRMSERKPINSAEHSSYTCGSVASALTSAHKAQHTLDLLA